MKKTGVLLALAVLSVLFVISFVSAAPVDDIKSVVNIITEILKPLFEQIVGDYADSSAFFAAVLILIIVFSIIWVALDRVDFFSENRWVLWLISISVSILSVRWISKKEIIDTIVLPYSVLGIALSAGLPFVLYFLVVSIGFQDQRYKFFRKVAWIFFAVIFLGLWISRYGDITGNIKWIYPITALLSLIMGFADGTVQGAMLRMKLGRIGFDNKQQAELRIKQQIADLPNLVSSGAITQAEADRLKKQYTKKLKWLLK